MARDQHGGSGCRTSACSVEQSQEKYDRSRQARDKFRLIAAPRIWRVALVRYEPGDSAEDRDRRLLLQRDFAGVVNLLLTEIAKRRPQAAAT
jgi:hypothetical protein